MLVGRHGLPLAVAVVLEFSQLGGHLPVFGGMCGSRHRFSGRMALHIIDIFSISSCDSSIQRTNMKYIMYPWTYLHLEYLFTAFDSIGMSILVCCRYIQGSI